MEITVHSSKSVTPDFGGDRSDGGAPAISADSVVPLSVFDKVSYDEYITGVCAFHPPAPPNGVLEAGLARALAEYREWAGRLGVDANGDRAIILNDAGARFVEATAGAELGSSIMQLTTGANLLSMYPSCDGADELLLVQVTRFRCGSIAVGVSMHHKVADGHAIWGFLFAWGQATGGVPISPAPVHDRTSLFARRDPPQVMFDHHGNEFKPRGKTPAGSNGNNVLAGDEVEIHRVHFTRRWISELKSEASEGAGRPCTTLQCLAAHLWRCITKARGLDGGETTRMRVAVNGRARMKNPQVPVGYTGNAVLWAWPATTVHELVDGPLRHAVELISREVARVDDAYFRSFIDFASSGVTEKEELVPTADSLELTLSPNVEVDSLLGIPFYEMDFGGARPFFFLPGYSSLPVDGFMYIVQSFEGEGSVDAYVPLFRRTMDAFKKCCYSSPSMGGERRV